MEDLALVFVILVALGFDFVNGFHDAANSIATVVSTRVLSPRHAVVWAATFNFIAFLFFGTKVASTIASDVVVQSVLTIGVIFAGLVGAIVWDLITFYLGLPTSSSHALVGGMAGAAVAKAGWGVLVTEGIRKIGLFIVLSPLIGLAVGLLLTVLISWMFHRVRRLDTLNKGFRRGQLVSAAAFSLGHGANDAQKTMGIILALLIAAGHLPSDADVPIWVVLQRARRHRPGHPHRRLAHREDDGLEDHPPAARRGRRGRVGRRRHAVLHVRRGHPGVHHPHHHRRHRRGGRRPSPLRRAVGRRRPRGVGLGAHHPRGLHHRRPGRIDPVGVLMTDRRARFFLLAALVCLIMIPLADHQFRTLTLGVSATYVLLALASYLDFRSRKKSDSDVP